MRRIVLCANVSIFPPPQRLHFQKIQNIFWKCITYNPLQQLNTTAINIVIGQFRDGRTTVASSLKSKRDPLLKPFDDSMSVPGPYPGTTWIFVLATRRSICEHHDSIKYFYGQKRELYALERILQTNIAQVCLMYSRIPTCGIVTYCTGNSRRACQVSLARRR